MLIPKIESLKESSSYIERQILLDIIDVNLNVIIENIIKSESKDISGELQADCVCEFK